jgi:hypothetical protein
MIVFMKNTATTELVKVKAGRYIYRGVNIRKSEKYGFIAVNKPESGPWHNLGHGTLSRCMAEIDAKLDNGHVAFRGYVYTANSAVVKAGK